MIDFYLGKNHLELVGAACAAVLVVFPLLKLSICGVRKQIGRLSLYAKILLGFCIVDSIIVCGTKTNEPPRSAGATLTGKAAILAAEFGAAKMAAIPVSGAAFPVRGDGNLWSVTPEDIARGYRVSSETTNETFSFEMLSNATIVGNWHKRGTFGEWMRLELGDFEFPLGSNDAVYASFSVFNDGKIRPKPRDIEHEIRAVGVPMLAMQGASRFWTDDGSDGSKILTWENFFLHADTSMPVNAQIRLWRSGDFSTRSNTVETAYSRINPHDWDGDGIANEIDDNPLLCDGDFFGPSNLLPEGANTNAYCSISIVVEGCDSLVSFLGEGASNYPDPYFIARAGATNDVLILIGKTYHVSSVSPVRCVGVSDAETEVDVHDSRSFSVVRPVSITFVDGDENPPLLRGETLSDPIWPYAKRISALVQPSSLGGEFSFRSCCSIECDGATISYLHDEYCSCRGCQGSGMYLYEGFGIPCSAPECCCASESGGGGGTGGQQEPPEPSASNPLFASFSSPYALYEDPYRNEERGSLYSGRAMPVSLNLGVYGGNYGGQWSLTIANEGRLRQKSGTESRSGTVAPGESLSMELEYNAVAPSGSADDIVATLAFAENFTGSNTTASAALTAVRFELEASEETCEAAKNRHVFGVAEDVLVKTEPANVPRLSFSASSGLFNPASQVWTCPVTNSPAICNLYASASGERMFAVYAIVEPPRRIVAERAIGLDFNIPQGTAGGAGMLLDLFVYPKTVSFSKLEMMEVPTETEGPSGYFTNTMFGAVWYHTTAMGAGEWKKIGIGSWNFWFPDEARMGDMLPSQNVLPWKSGTIIWDIPVAWRLAETNDRSYGNLIPVVYEQRFDFNTNGTLRVTKHDYWEERDSDNQMRGSEGIHVWTPFQYQEPEE